MNVPINPVTIDGEVCSQAVLSIAMSSSLALRGTPVDAAGVEYPDAMFAIVGGPDQPDIAAFFAAVGAAAETLLVGRGI